MKYKKENINVDKKDVINKNFVTLCNALICVAQGKHILVSASLRKPIPCFQSVSWEIETNNNIISFRHNADNNSSALCINQYIYTIKNFNKRYSTEYKCNLFRLADKIEELLTPHNF